MPSTVKIRVAEARGLPVMDKKSKLADTYVQIKFGDHQKKLTSICWKTLNPVWEEDFRFEVPDDIALQDTPVQFIVWDNDALKDDSVGSAVVDLNSLLEPDSPGKISGWLPLFDTLQGIRGMLRLKAKVHFVNDMNPFKDSAAGVRFFSASTLDGHVIERIHGFVEELILKKDPEYSIYDNFRTSRKSNEARQLLLKTLASQVRRNVGRKAIDLGGNAVLGYKQLLDLEEAGGTITARAYGTACSIRKVASADTGTDLYAGAVQPTVPMMRSVSTPVISLSAIQQQELAQLVAETGLPEENIRKWKGDVHLFTMNSLPPSIRFQTAGIVSAKSIKLLDSRESETTRREERDQWWTELRSEVRSHARALKCPYVVGYIETTSIFEDICVLSAYGTAMRLHTPRAVAMDHVPPTRSRANSQDAGDEMASPPIHNRRRRRRKKRGTAALRPCSACHVPYEKSAPFTMTLSRCMTCHKKLVPEVLLSTTEPVDDQYPILGQGRFVEARVCRPRFSTQEKQSGGEAGAIAVSEGLPFLEHALHTQLLYKLRVMGMNAAFSIRIQVVVGEALMAGVITATAVYLACLPPPQSLSIKRFIEVKDAEDEKLVLVQRQIESLSASNQQYWEQEVHRWQERCLRYQAAVERRGLPRSTSAESSPTKSPFPRVLRPEAIASRIAPLALGPAANTSPVTEMPSPSRVSKGDSDSGRVRPIALDSAPDAIRAMSGPAELALGPVSGPAPSSLTPGGSPGGGALGRVPLRRGMTAPPVPAKGSLGRERRGTRYRFLADDRSSEDSDSSSVDEDVLAHYPRNQKSFIMQIDDDTDEDIMAVLLEPTVPDGTFMCNSELPPGLGTRTPSSFLDNETRALSWGTVPDVSTECTNEQLINAVTRVAWVDWDPQHLNQLFANVFLDLHTQIAFRARFFSPCCITNVTSHISLPEESVVEVVLTAMVVSLREEPIKMPTNLHTPPHMSPLPKMSKGNTPRQDEQSPVRRHSRQRSASASRTSSHGPPADASSWQPVAVLTDEQPGSLNADLTTILSGGEMKQDVKFGAGYPRVLPSLRPELMMDQWEQWKIMAGSSKTNSTTDVRELNERNRTLVVSPSKLPDKSPSHSRDPTTGSNPQDFLAKDSDTKEDGDDDDDEEEDDVFNQSKMPDEASSSDSSESEVRMNDHRDQRQRYRSKASENKEQKSIDEDAVSSASSSSTDTEDEFWEEERRREKEKFFLQRQAFAQGQASGNIVECTPLSFVPNKRIVQYLGRVELFLIEERDILGRDRSALGSFTHRFLKETNAVARATVATRGGNALVAYSINTMKVKVNRDKAYSIISLSGDAVLVADAPDEEN